jgi:dihydroorotase-like cyclic amidohydrolase
VVQGALMVSDEEFLAGLRHCKSLGALAMVHAENGDAVAAGQRWVAEELAILGPQGHALSRPAMLESEATGRAIRLAHFVGTPLYVVHVMSEDAMREVCYWPLIFQFFQSRVTVHLVGCAVRMVCACHLLTCTICLMNA